MLFIENKQLKVDLKVLYDKYIKLFVENSELCKNWSVESEELYEVNKELCIQNDKLKIKIKELFMENVVLYVMFD